MKKFLTAMILALGLVPSAFSIYLPVQWNWTGPTTSVNGESLDINGDGDCSDGLTGYKLYKVASSSDGTRVDQLADLGDWTLSNLQSGYNYPAGEHCFAITAYFEDRPGQVYRESANSNVVCKDWEEVSEPMAPVNFQIVKWLKGLITNV